MHVLIVHPRAGELTDFVAALQREPGLRLSIVDSAEAGLVAARRDSPHQVLLPEDLPVRNAKTYLTELLQVDAMINTAVCSPRSETDFHEFYEGLGVLLQLPELPTAAQAPLLVHRLRDLA